MLGCTKYTHQLADHNKVTQSDFILEICSYYENYFPLHPKTDTTAQLYCTLSMCKTPKTISHCKQKTNAPPQLYCIISSTCILTKTFFPPEPKTDITYSTTRKKVPPAHAKRVYLFLRLSVHLCVRAKRGIE